MPDNEGGGKADHRKHKKGEKAVDDLKKEMEMVCTMSCVFMGAVKSKS